MKSIKPREIAFAALLLLHLVPLWAFDYFPSQDGLSHLYNATIIRNYTREEFAVYREFYNLQHTFGVNWLIHLGTSRVDGVGANSHGREDSTYGIRAAFHAIPALCSFVRQLNVPCNSVPRISTYL